MKERWTEIKTVFNEVFDLPPEERARALDRPDLDPWVRRQVESLLGAAESGGGLLDRPAILGLSSLAEPGGQSGSLVGRAIGRYQVVREIGRGGMGTVYEGSRIDAEFEQRVAIKTLRLGLGVPELVSQFRHERQILAALQHPKIAALLDGGVTDDGIPYIVLEYVDGVAIDRYCESNQLGLRARLDLFRQVLDAVQYAHRQLVIHRDIKPSNILVTQDGHAKLLDFGIARLIRADGRELTQPGTPAITPAYASPEQLRGERASTATDVYSLALVLYRLLTGKSPLTDELVSPAELLAALSTGPLPPPSADPAPTAAATMGVGSVERLKRLLAGELDAVVLKALRIEPERRYSSVDALADDLRRYLKGLPVTARPDTAWYRFSTFVRRRRATVAASIVAAAALIGGTAVSAWQAREATIQARRATKVATFLQQVIGASAPLAAFRAPRLGPGATVGALIDSAAGRIDAVTTDDPEINVVLHHLFGLVYQSQERPTEAAREFAAMERKAAATFGPGLAGATVLAARAAAAIERQDWAAADAALAAAAVEVAALDAGRPDRYGLLLDQFGLVPPYPWAAIRAGVESQLLLATAGSLAGQGRAADAVAAARTALDRATAGGAAPDTRAEAMAALGSLQLAASGDRTDGVRLLREALALLDSLPDPDVPAKATVLWALVSNRAASGATADSLGREAFRIVERATGPNSLTVARHLWLRGSTARLRGDTATQRTSLVRAMRIVAAHPAPPAELAEAVVMEYARAHWLAGDLDSAVVLAEGIYARRARGGSGFPTAEAGQLLGALLRTRGERTPGTRAADFRAAETVLLQADSIMRRLVPPDHFWPQMTAGSLALLYTSWGNRPMARRFLALLADSTRRRIERPTP